MQIQITIKSNIIWVGVHLILPCVRFYRLIMAFFKFASDFIRLW